MNGEQRCVRYLRQRVHLFILDALDRLIVSRMQKILNRFLIQNLMERWYMGHGRNH